MQLYVIVLVAALVGNVYSSHLNRVQDVMDEGIFKEDSMEEDRFQNMAQGYRQEDSYGDSPI